MRFKAKIVVLLTGVAFAGGLSAKEKPAHIDVLTCTRSDGAIVATKVYAYSIATGSSEFVTVYFAASEFIPWLFEEIGYSTGFSSCTFAGIPTFNFGSVSPVSVSAAGVGVFVDAGALTEDAISQRYTEVILSYRGISASGSVLPQVVTPKSPEEQAKALTEYRARGLAIPKH